MDVEALMVEPALLRSYVGWWETNTMTSDTSGNGAQEKKEHPNPISGRTVAAALWSATKDCWYVSELISQIQ